MEFLQSIIGRVIKELREKGLSNVLAVVNQDNGLLNSILLSEKDMKKKLSFDQEIYLPEYFSNIVARSFEKESEQSILYGDFTKALGEKVKM